MATKFRQYAMVLALGLALATPAWADTTPPDLKADIDGLIHRIEGATRGIVKWDGADKIDVRQDGDASIADIINARVLIVSPAPPPPPPPPPGAPARPSPHATGPVARILLDKIEVRRAPAADGALDLRISLPKTATVTATDNSDEATLTLANATIHALLDAPSEHAREISSGFASARIDDKTTGGWITFGPLTSFYKIVAAADGSWTSPGSSELKNIAFFFPKAPLGGSIDRVTGSGEAAGPDLAALNRMRDHFAAMQQQSLSPPERTRAFLGLLPDLLAAYTKSAGSLTVEGVTVHKKDKDSEPLFTLKTASIATSLNGLSGTDASLRITLKHDGLDVASSVPNAERIPRRGVADFGVESVSTATLRSLIAAAMKASEATTPPEHQAANQQVMAAAMALTPVFHIYDFALDVQDAGVDANGQAKGSPMSPKGYTADADIAVRNFDALRDLMSGAPFAPYLPLLKEIGTAAQAGGNVPETKFHLASAPGKWITLNGDDVSAWFASQPPGQGQPRALKPAARPLSGDDVRAVQHALADAKIEAPQNGLYDGDTAAAVARFQKANNLNVNGVVDAATRQKLGIKADAAPTKPPN